VRRYRRGKDAIEDAEAKVLSEDLRPVFVGTVVISIGASARIDGG
jgi:hypothetical protein